MNKRTAHILTCMVDNEFGVLTRITAQIRREGWNIKSLAVAESMDPAISRITLTLECFDATLPTVLHRLTKLACVRMVTAYDQESHICRELAVARVAVMDEAIRQLCTQYGASILQELGQSALIELSDMPSVLDSFVQALEAKGEVSVARTGPITLER